MKHLAFVSQELYPLTAGGIGRVLYNILFSMAEADRKRSIVILVGERFDLLLASATFPEVRFECLDDVSQLQESERFPPRHAYSNTEWHWRSVCVLRKLLKLEREGIEFDYIEFPDWGALGFASTQERLFSAALSQATLAVRLHSTEGVLHSFEAHRTNKNTLALYDIERKTLRDCDRVIAQLMPIADYNCELYGFDPAEWMARVVVHAAPVLTDRAPRAKPLRITLDTPLLFTSKFQQFKAPDVFVRACVGFMRLCPEYSGEVRFLAHNTDAEIFSYVRSLIPADLAGRFHFYDSIPHGLREQIIADGIAVFPSRFESFCLAAYEASLLGASVVLNENNPAFGDNTPWRDGENCIKFCGTVDSLVGSLKRLFSGTCDLVSVSRPADIEPWRMARGVKTTCPSGGAAEIPLVSVIIPNFNLGRTLPYTLRSVVESNYPNIEIIVFDDASTDPQTIEMVRRLEDCGNNRALRIFHAGYNRGLAGARNFLIGRARGKYILPLDADDLISTDFISKAVGALERNLDYDFVIPQTAYFSEARNEVPRQQSQYLDFAIFHGEAVACGFFENRFSTATMLTRRVLFDEIQYREEFRALEDWELYLRSAIAGKRFIVSNEIHFFYRRRCKSMIGALADPLEKEMRYDELRRSQVLQAGGLKIPAYVFSALEREAMAANQVSASNDRELRRLNCMLSENGNEIRRLTEELNALSSSEAVRIGLRAANFMNKRTPWLLRPFRALINARDRMNKSAVNR